MLCSPDFASCRKGQRPAESGWSRGRLRQPRVREPRSKLWAVYRDVLGSHTHPVPLDSVTGLALFLLRGQ